MAFGQMDGPIPGANYTSDTKNYPWHRPPEHTDLDGAIDAIATKILDEDSLIGILTMVEMGVDLTTLTDMILTSGIGAGKWTVDFALLLAGPTSHILYLLCEAYGLDCDLGIEDKGVPITKAFFDGFKEVDKAKAASAAGQVNVEEVKEKVNFSGGGFMSMAKGAK